LQRIDILKEPSYKTVLLKNIVFVSLGLITLLGFILRFYTIGDRSLWMDELLQVSYYNSDSFYRLILNAASQSQPSLDYTIGYLLFSFLDISEVVVRFPALIFGTLTIIITFYLARHLFSTEVAILAALFTCISKYMVEYSQEARPYSIFFFFLLFTMLIYFKAIAEDKRRYWVYFGFSLYTMLLTRGFMPIVVVLSLNLLILMAFFLNIKMFREINIFTVKKTILTFIISFIALIAYSPFFFIIVQSPRGYVSTPFHFSISSIFNTLRHFPIERMTEHFIALTQPLTPFFLFFSILGIIFIALQGRHRPINYFFVIFVIVVPFIQTFIQQEKDLPVFLRYSVYYLPFLYILTSVGIVSSSEFIVKRFNPSRNITLLIMVLIAAPVMVINGFNLSYYYNSSEKTDWRGVSQHLMQTLRRDDVILAESFAGYGDWNPGFYGRWLYFKGTNRDFDIYGLTNQIIADPRRKGNIVLLLMDYPWGREPKIESEKVEVKKFTNLNVIRLRKPSELLLENLLILLSEMSKFMPNDSSRVDLFANKAKIYYFLGNKEAARVEFDNAKMLVPERKKNLFRKITKSFEEILKRE
jgi:hypothetical protein